MASRYLPHGPFYEELNRRVDGYFAQARLSPRGTARMWRKTAIILTWWAASWVALVFFAHAWWQVALAVVSLGLAVAGIGFNVMHDGGHRATSDKAGVNRAMALMLDVIGGSSYVWNWKHNVHHHSNPNVPGWTRTSTFSRSSAWRRSSGGGRGTGCSPSTRGSCTGCSRRSGTSWTTSRTC